MLLSVDAVTKGIIWIWSRTHTPTRHAYAHIHIYLLYNVYRCLCCY